MAGFIKGLIDWGSNKLNKFLGGASDFLGATPEYISKVPGQNRVFRTGNVANMNAFNALDYVDFDPGSQGHLNAIYRTMNSGDFKDRYFQHQLEQGYGGMFGSKFGNFDLLDGGKHLNDKQLGSLSQYFDTEYASRFERFQDLYLPNGAVSVGPQQKLSYNVGLQKRYLGTKEGMRQMQMAHGMSGSKNGESIIDAAIRKNAGDAGTLNAYRDHLNSHLVDAPGTKGRWSAPKSFGEWATEQGIEDSEIKRLSKELASGNPDHSGIDIWGMAKRHPVIATGVVMGTAWGVSEMYEEDL